MSILDEAPEWADEEFDSVERDLRAKQQRPADDVVDLSVLDEQTKVQLAKQVSQATVPGAMAEHDRCNNLHAKASQGQLKEMGNLRWIQKNRRGAEHTWDSWLPSERAENATEEQPIDDFQGRMHDIRSTEDMRENEELKKRRRRRAKWCLLLVLVVLVLFGTGVGIAVALGGSSTQKDAPTNDAEVMQLFHECYMRNETVPSDRFSRIRNVVAAAWTWRDSSIDSATQRAALCWLSEVDYFTLATATEADYEVVQRFALATMFYHFFGVSIIVEGDRRTGGSWHTGENWLDGIHVCQLDGVGCGDGPNNRVTKLILSSLRVSTPIPEDIALLSDLAYLRLADNSFTGQIPSVISTLTKLNVLNLTLNRLTGTIPSELGGLSELHILSFAGNDIEGQIPTQLGGLSELHILNIAGNDIEGQLTAWLFQLPALRYLYLSENRFTGTLPSALENRFTGMLPSALENATALRNLRLDNNAIQGQIPPWLFQIPALQQLHLAKNRFTGTLPSALENAIALRGLDLHNNEIQGSFPDVSLLKNLEWLDLSVNRLITGMIPSAVWFLPRLEVIRLNVTSLTGTIPAAIDTLTTLQELRLGFTSINGRIPTTIGNLSALRILDLDTLDGLTGTIPTELARLSRLDTLLLPARSNLSGGIPDEVCNLPSPPSTVVVSSLAFDTFDDFLHCD